MTNDPQIQPVSDELLDAILDLNNRHATELSWLEREELAALTAKSFHCRIIGAPETDEVAAFLMSFEQDADYGSPNFHWFKMRYPRFVYVDRVVVDPVARGRGHARRLYEDLFDVARVRGQALVTAEVNADPPNPASDAFHTAMDFAPVGEADIHGGAKTVRYYVRSL